MDIFSHARLSVYIWGSDRSVDDIYQLGQSLQLNLVPTSPRIGYAFLWETLGQCGPITDPRAKF